MRTDVGFIEYLPRYLAVYCITRLVATLFISAAAPSFATAISFLRVASGI